MRALNKIGTKYAIGSDYKISNKKKIIEINTYLYGTLADLQVIKSLCFTSGFKLLSTYRFI